jgi:hypothetical protein
MILTFFFSNKMVCESDWLADLELLPAQRAV